jgi:hypothetical protein
MDGDGAGRHPSFDTPVYRGRAGSKGLPMAPPSCTRRIVRGDACTISSQRGARLFSIWKLAAFPWTPCARTEKVVYLGSLTINPTCLNGEAG